MIEQIISKYGEGKMLTGFPFKPSEVEMAVIRRAKKNVVALRQLRNSNSAELNCHTVRNVNLLGTVKEVTNPFTGQGGAL